MSITDTPIKVLLRNDPIPLAAWLLDTQESTIDGVCELNIDLPAGTLRVDTLLQIIFKDGSQTLLHIEIQGRRNEHPMNRRMLNYNNAIVQNELDISDGLLCSVVIYVGKGAGKNDNGEYAIDCPLGGKTLMWRYRVIRLWEIKAETLLEMDKPSLLALVGQTHIDNPREMLPKVIKRIQEQVLDADEQAKVFSVLVSLIEDQEVSLMTEKMLEKMDVELLDTPFLRRIRQEAYAEAIVEGREQGKVEGKVEGIVEGKVEGKVEGTLTALRNNLLDVISLRFDVPLRTYRQFEAQVDNISDIDSLRSIFKEAVTAQDFDSLTNILKDAVIHSRAITVSG